MLRTIVILACLLLAPAPAFAQAPVDPAKFTTEMADRISAASGKKLSIAESLVLNGPSDSGKEPMRIFLDRIYQYCLRNPADACEGTKQRYVAATADSLAGMPPLTRERLRIVVRDAQYCASAVEMLSDREHAPLTRPLVQGLCALLVADYPNSRVVITEKNLAEMKIGAAAAWLSGDERTRADNAGLLDKLDLDGNPAMLTGGDYLPSVLLDTEGWRRLAARTHGTILVAVPGDDGVFVVRGDQIEDLAGLRKTVREQYEAAERGISPLVYRWSSEGWMPVD